MTKQASPDNKRRSIARQTCYAINIELTSASATAYQPSASPEYWASGINDWLAMFQLACCNPEVQRFRIANTSPTPASMMATEVGSGVAVGTAVNVNKPSSGVGDA